ncbi:hypothetical protein VP01_452g2 [Puccinia sorghi]|uniref:Uncharacterized protein n=1 Tax=Puccinia sorghi TaxID=27349 RepID=A0A0L6UQY6_9BASI|nr:hypothetical protein VP01_452g2 [Puccinia sorghi]
MTNLSTRMSLFLIRAHPLPISILPCSNPNVRLVSQSLFFVSYFLVNFRSLYILAIHARELIHYRSEGIGTLISTYGDDEPDESLKSHPIGLQEYFAAYPDGDLVLLVLPISPIYRNILMDARRRVTLAIKDELGTVQRGGMKWSANRRRQAVGWSGWPAWLLLGSTGGGEGILLWWLRRPGGHRLDPSRALPPCRFHSLTGIPPSCLDDDDQQQEELMLQNHWSESEDDDHPSMLSKTHLKHHHISSLIQQLKHSQPEQAITLFHDLEIIWNYPPTDQDNLAYITAATQAHPRSESELAQLVRLAIKYNLKDQHEKLLREKSIKQYHDQQLIHGALLLISQDSQQFILNQLNNNQKIQQHWIEQDLIQALAQQDQLDLLFHTLSNLSSWHHNRDRLINLIDRLLSHIPLPIKNHHPPSPHILRIHSLAERILQTTGIEIFRDKPERLAGKLFIRLNPSYTFDHVWAWYQLSKSRTGGRVLESCLIVILQFRAELTRKHSDLLDQVLSDFRALALVSRSLSPVELVGCIENILWLAIETKRAPLACAALDLELIKLLEGNHTGLMEGERMVELLGLLFSLAESREQAYMFYERLAQLGRPTPRFFERLLRGYLALCESPRATLQERPQALPMPRLMAILQHMKHAGIPPDSQTYAILLNHYSAVVRCNPRNLSTRLQLERIHTLIKLDINLEPDPQLIHQLFKAFSYNGLYDKAWAIWDQFFSPRPDAFSNNKKKLTSMEHLRKVSNPSFATMFDLAGFESERHGDGRLNMKAIQGWNFLLNQSLLRRGSSFPGQSPVRTEEEEEEDTSERKMMVCCSSLNKNLFDAWIECLCRSGRIEEACMLVFPPAHAPKEGEDCMVDDDESQSSSRSVEEVYMVTKQFVDQRTLSLLLRFAKRHDSSSRHSPSETVLRRPNIVAAVQSHFPHLWPVVSDQGRFN